MKIVAREVEINVHDNDLQGPDILTIDEVIERDVYRLRARKAAGFEPRRIVDIGAHIGTFTCLAGALWPDASILSFEANRKYFDMLAINAPRNANPINAAVLGYRGRQTATGHMLYHGHGDESVFGKWFCVGARDIMALQPEIDLLKIDCEGSEVEIFREMEEFSLLPAIQTIVGEWHREPAKREVVRILSKYHHVTVVEHGQCNQFEAERMETPCNGGGCAPAWPQMRLSEIADRFTIQQLHIDNNGAPDLDEMDRLLPFVSKVSRKTLLELKEVNGRIWALESSIRKGELTDPCEVGRRAISIRDLNKIRVAIKNAIGADHGETPTVKFDHASA